MDFDAILLPPRRARSIANGWWFDRTINGELDACISASPDKTALTAVRSESGELRQFSYRELGTLADRIAVGLSRLGVGRNDVVAMQLPNWWHFSLLYLACSRIGAVLNPLMHIFRERELSFMLGHGQAKLVIVPKHFRGFDHEAMARALQPGLPHLQRVIVVDGDVEQRRGGGLRVHRGPGRRGRDQAGTAPRPARVRAMIVFMICAVPSPIWNPSTSRRRCSIGPRS